MNYRINTNITLTILLLLLKFSTVFSQIDPALDGPVSKNNKRGNFIDKTYTGGNFALQVSTISLIDISPLIGYRITDEFSVGLGGTYMYYSNSYYKYKTNIYGGRAFARYYLLSNLFAHGEYEILNMDVYNSLIQDFSRKNIESLLGGLGYRQNIGEKSGINIMILWNFNDIPESPYTNPIFRVGFDIGL